MLACTGVNNPDKPSTKNGALSGEFTINSSAKKVHFSQGNLQYNASKDTWRFAENQYDIVGSDNSNINSPTYEGWIDLFGWGTGNSPMLCSTSDDVYTAFVDWGVNKISNGGNNVNYWRTLTRDEWVYIFHNRPYAEYLFGLGKVDSISGIILLPDNWKTPESLTFLTSKDQNLEWIDHRESGIDLSYYNSTTYNDVNVYSIAEWIRMENAGAVFLPAAGYRYASVVDAIGSNGVYWSSSPRSSTDAFNIIFNSHQVWPQLCYNRRYGLAVRLVHE